MKQYAVVGDCLQGVSLDDARKYAHAVDLSDEWSWWNPIRFASHEDTVNGLHIFYDYGADYYFFTREGGPETRPHTEGIS